MARIKEVFVSGTIANLIFYQFSGKPCVRSKPANVRQTAATKKAGRRFGKTKTVSRLLRQSFPPLLFPVSGRSLMYQVDKGVLTWIRKAEVAKDDTQLLPGFAIGQDADCNSLFPVSVGAAIDNGTLKVWVSGTTPITPTVGTSGAVLTFVVCCMNPGKGGLLRTEQKTIEIDPASAAAIVTVLDFDLVLSAGVFVALSAAIRYPQATESKRRTSKQTKDRMAVLQGWYCRK